MSIESVDLHGGVVEIHVREDGGVVWVSVDGVTRLRVSKPSEVFLNQKRGSRFLTKGRAKL
jgi:sugar lactone lactonase YvrE